MKLLKFYADWCSPCKAISTQLETMDLKGIEVQNINIDEEENAELVKEHGIRSIPVLILVDSNNTVLERKTGMQMNWDWLINR